MSSKLGNFFRYVIAGFSFWLVFFCSAAIANNDPAQAKGLLWEVKSGEKIVYLFGSIHLAKPDFYPLSPAVEAAYQGAAVLAVEVDATDADAIQKIMPLVVYAAPDNLRKHLSVKTWKQLTGMLGPEAKQMEQMKPMIVSSALALGLFTSRGYKTEAGIDQYFLRRAKADGKKIQELETLEFQCRVLTDLSDADGDEMLSQLLTSFKNGEALKVAEGMVTAWKAGDAPALAALFQEEAGKNQASTRLMKHLLDDRNVGISQKIAALLNDGIPALIVVGAGHLAGANSIVDILQKQDFQVRQLR